jgi:hypothetical protein
MNLVTPTLKTTLPEPTQRKRPAEAAAKKDKALSQPTPTTGNRIRTVLVASYGWPTDAAQLPKKRSVKR